jgi:hypothetical protein
MRPRGNHLRRQQLWGRQLTNKKRWRYLSALGRMTQGMSVEVFVKMAYHDAVR